MSTLSPYVSEALKAEDILIRIWSAALHLPPSDITPESSFFELGGGSAEAASILSQVHEQFGIKLPLVALFDAPTVSGMAGQIQARSSTNRQTSYPTTGP